MSEEQYRQSRDKRRWQITKEVPLSLLISVAGMLVLGGMGYQSLKDDVRIRADGETRLTDALEETNKELRVLANEYRQSAVPAAEVKWRIQLLEQNVSEMSRKVSILEANGRTVREK